MDINKALILEEAVDSVGRYAAYSKNCGEEVGPGPQMGDCSQELNAVAFFLQRVIRRGGPFNGDALRFELKGLLCLRR